jgi:dihydroflavonol-4-reductase
VKKLCHVSSTAAIGRNKDSDLITEKTQWKNAPENSWYAITKYNAEREVWRGIEEGLPAVIVNPCVILGPADWNSGSTAMFRQASAGMKFYTEGGNAVVDVRDVAEIMVGLMESKTVEQRYLLIGENLPFRQLFDKIAAAFGKKPASIRANRFMTGFAWRWEALMSRISGRKPLITRETARAAHATYLYDAKKNKIRTWNRLSVVG